MPKCDTNIYDSTRHKIQKSAVLHSVEILSCYYAFNWVRYDLIVVWKYYILLELLFIYY